MASPRPSLHYERAGTGEPLLLLHPGFADSRIWDPQWRFYSRHYQLWRCDLPGFGRSPIETLPVSYARDVATLLDQHQVRGAAILGSSLGGRIALELALARPELVRALVLVGAALPEHARSPAMRSYTRALQEAFTRRDLDAAVEISLRAWVDGPHRSPADVDPDVRAAVAEMQRQTFQGLASVAAEFAENPLVPDLTAQLAELEAETLIIVGDLDSDELKQQAKTLLTAIPHARFATVPGTAHAPNFERPDAFNALVLPFLAHSSGP